MKRQPDPNTWFDLLLIASNVALFAWIAYRIWRIAA